ncbi:type III-B CRISPR-associated protein Cas10/Cmr2 [Almyronema epifaneia]|uniref:Type III-B CRISPR-associated protein Cas10/Cmr2 n=1 Tax=Almyronema epifaneia S1 TaxID=2991925 RepID=A0ABW6IK93_9CYAN
MTDAANHTAPYYARKLYAFLRSAKLSHAAIEQLNLNCLDPLSALETWWSASEQPQSIGQQIEAIAASSDRVNLHATAAQGDRVSIRHPISGEPGTVSPKPAFPTIPADILSVLRRESDAQKVFAWFWRFYPELWLNPQGETLADGLLYPAHLVLPDCPLHSYQATVSALTGARFPNGWQQEESPAHPYLLIFTFSPIQDFIKASRKFLDFWAGSYLLHYLSARLCWHIAQKYGPDAIIVPSLWGQDIFDAFWLEHHPGTEFADVLKTMFKTIGDQKTPVERFTDGLSTSLSTAGFPNVITALVPGLGAAKELGDELADVLQAEWIAIGEKVRDHIRHKVSQEAAAILDNQWDAFWTEIKEGLPKGEPSKPYKSDLSKWRSQRNQHNQQTYPTWEWCKLWDVQLKNAWEPYWAAVPLGDPNQPLSVSKANGQFEAAWKNAQSELSQAWVEIPSTAEEHTFDTLNVGSWWGSFQQRLRIAIQTVKNTRTWNIPIAPGERSTISGQYSAVHPNLNYRVVNRRGADQDFREGGGLPEGSMRLFWLLMAKAYPGLFSGSERLNALELTKRMAWIYGDVADALGIPVQKTIKRITKHKRLLNQIEIDHVERFLYDRFVRFPNLSSIAAARFIRDDSEIVRNYCRDLENAIAEAFDSKYKRIFRRVARIRPGHIPQTDRHINPKSRKRDYLNGVMFSAKWLAEDLGLGLDQTQQLRGLVEKVHHDNGFKEGSPSDWWAIVLADGDGMGQYISGSKLEKYRAYINQNLVPEIPGLAELYNTDKRMGPATHIGLNRALLDFSNRLVPYLTEKRFCGKVIYSGGDDVMAVLPIEDLPDYLRSLRSAWSGAADPGDEFDHGDGYWRPKPEKKLKGLPNRPLFTMGCTATMSMGVVIAHKSVPLPTVLENLWEAESDRAKEMVGKDGLCFRVIYSGGNVLEALMKGHLLDQWAAVSHHYDDKLSPLLYRLAEELPKRVDVSHPDLFPLAAQVIMKRRDSDRQLSGVEVPLQEWLTAWAQWAQAAASSNPDKPGATSEDIGYLLRFTAFWVDKMVQRQKWRHPTEDAPSHASELATAGR